MKIALVQLGAFGDCLYATVIARQIKYDYPGCHLTWVIADKYASVADGNPNVDYVEVINTKQQSESGRTPWETACASTKEQLANGALTHAFYTQILPDNMLLYDGLIRSTIYRAYGRPIDGPHQPEIFLREEENENARQFALNHRLSLFKHVFLFECGPQSGQSEMTPIRAENIAHTIAAKYNDVVFLLSSAVPLKRETDQVVDASVLSCRENASLSHYCTGLIGCSSGITWVTTSTAGKRLPMLQILSGSSGVFKFASVARDFEKFQLDPVGIIEMKAPKDEEIISCIDVWISRSHGDAYSEFNQDVRLTASHASNAFRLYRTKTGRFNSILSLRNFLSVSGVNAIPWTTIAGDLTLITRMLGQFGYEPRNIWE